MRFNFTFYKDFTLWAERKFLQKAKGAEQGADWAEVAEFVREVFSAIRELLRPLGDIAKLLKGGKGLVKQIKVGGGILAFVATHPDPFANGRAGIRALYEKYGDAPASYKPNVAGFGGMD